MNNYNTLEIDSLYPLFISACAYGDHSAVVEMFKTGRINANYWGAQAIRSACEYDHKDIVDFLYAYSNVEVALNVLKKMYPNNEKFWGYLEYKIANEQRMKIFSEIQQDNNLNEVKKRL